MLCPNLHNNKYLEKKTSHHCATPDSNCQKYTITPEFCEKNSGLCNGKTYTAGHQKQDSSPSTNYCQMDIEITRNFNNKITNSEVKSIISGDDCNSQCRPLKTGEVERIYEIILNNETKQNKKSKNINNFFNFICNFITKIIFK